jgi:hypothetical protein
LEGELETPLPRGVNGDHEILGRIDALAGAKRRPQLLGPAAKPGEHEDNVGLVSILGAEGAVSYAAITNDFAARQLEIAEMGKLLALLSQGKRVETKNEYRELKEGLFRSHGSAIVRGAMHELEERGEALRKRKAAAKKTAAEL